MSAARRSGADASLTTLGPGLAHGAGLGSIGGVLALLDAGSLVTRSQRAAAPGACAAPELGATAAELLTVARGLASALGGPLVVVWTGALRPGTVAVPGSHGVARVRHLTDVPASSAELARALGP